VARKGRRLSVFAWRGRVAGFRSSRGADLLADTAELVLEALRPLINLRESLARTGSEAETEAELDNELAPIDLPEGVTEGEDPNQG
jgi:hypothetical protein